MDRSWIGRLARTVALGAALPLLVASTSWAVPISPGGSVNNPALPGTTEIYAIFGHSPGGGTQAFQIDFAAGAGNVFTFSASGTIGCCGSVNSTFGPDGSPGGMNISGGNSGLSSLSGNSLVPLVGVFVDTDPQNQVPPAALAFDSTNQSDLSPLLNQVFYIGDGRNGHNNALGTVINFTAPSNATKLFLGVIDAFGFGGSTAAYNDNPGSFDVTANLAQQTPGGSVPEPATMALLGLGLAGVAARALRRR